MQNFGLKAPILRKVKDTIKILSNRDLRCRKFAIVCQKTARSRPPTFLTHDAALIELLLL